MMENMDRYLTGSLMTLNQARDIDNDDQIDAEKLTVKSMISNVKPIFKSFHFNKELTDGIRKGDNNVSLIKAYFLECVDPTDVANSKIVPLEQVSAITKDIVKKTTGELNKILQKITTGESWAQDTMDILQQAGGSYVDFTKNKGFVFPADVKSLKELTVLLHEAHIVMKTNLAQLIAAAKSCYKTVKLSSNVDIDPAQGKVSVLPEYAVGSLNIKIDTPTRSLLVTQHRQTGTHRGYIESWVDVSDKMWKDLNDSFNDALAGMTTVSTFLATISMITELKLLYLLLLKDTQMALDNMNQFTIPTRLKRLLRQYGMTGDISDLQYRELYKTTCSEAKTLMDNFEGWRDILEEKFESKVENAEIIFANYFLKSKISTFTTLYAPALALQDKWRKNIDSLPDMVQHVFDLYIDTIIPDTIVVPGADNKALDVIASAIKEIKICDDPIKPAGGVAPRTNAKSSTDYVGDQISTITGKLSTLKKLQKDFNSAAVADKGVVERYKTALGICEDLFKEVFRMITNDPDSVNATDREEFTALRKKFLSDDCEDYHETLSSMLSRVHDAEANSKYQQQMQNQALPRLDNPVFSNKKQDFINWRFNFKMIFGDKLPKERKLAGLISCLRGEALDLIKGADFDYAMSLLECQYGREQDEVHRTIASLEALRPPQDPYEYRQVLIKLASAKRWLSKLNQAHKLDRTRLMQFVGKLFKSTYAVKFQDTVQAEEKRLMRIYREKYNVSHEDIEIARSNGNIELNVDDETYSEIFWDFVHSEARSHSTVNTIKRPTGPIFKKADYDNTNEYGDKYRHRDSRRYRNNDRDRRRSRDRNDTRLNQSNVDRSCALCKGKHFTNQCQKWIPTKGPIAPDIMERLSRSGTCIRCLKPKFEHHSAKCTYEGYSYVKDGVRKFHKTDCSKCSNQDTRLHYKICFCRQGKADKNKPKQDKDQDTRSDDNPHRKKYNDYEQKKQRDDKKKDHKADNKEKWNKRQKSKMKLIMDMLDDDSEESADEQDDANGHYTCCMTVNTPEQEGVIQLIELTDIITEHKGLRTGSTTTKTLMDTGTPKCHVDLEFAEQIGAERMETSHRVKTLHGETDIDSMFKIKMRTINGVAEIHCLGVKDLSMRYKSTTVKIPHDLVKKYQIHKNELNIPSGRVNIVLGSSAHRIWPDQVQRHAEGILFKSVITGRHLFFGAKNEVERSQKSTLSVLGKIMCAPRIHETPMQPDYTINEKINQAIEDEVNETIQQTGDIFDAEKRVLKGTDNSVDVHIDTSQQLEEKDEIVCLAKKEVFETKTQNQPPVVKAVNYNEQETKFWKNYGVDENEISIIKSCKKCLNCSTCKENMGKTEEFVLQKRMLWELTEFRRPENKWHSAYIRDDAIYNNLRDNGPYVLRHMERFNRSILKHGKEAVDNFNQNMNQGMEMTAFDLAANHPELDVPENRRRFHTMNVAFSGKSSTAARPTFDSSTVSYPSEKSTNAAFSRGPTSLNLHKSMLFIRSKIHINSCDVRKAYWQIRKDKKAQSVSRLYLPINKDGKVEFGSNETVFKEHVALSCIFGEVSAGSCLQVSIEKSTVEFKVEERTAKVLVEYLYADDAILGHDNEKVLIEMMAEIDRMFKEANMSTHPWLYQIGSSGTLVYDEVANMLEEFPKVFGYKLDPSTQKFHLVPKINLSTKKRNKYEDDDLTDESKVDAYLEKYPVTRRRILKLTVTAWDCTGELCIIQTQLRLAFRETLIEEDFSKLGWDGVMSQRAFQRYKRIIIMLLKLRGYTFDRLVVTAEEQVESSDFPLLVSFGDGSPTAACGLCYIVQKLKNKPGNHAALVMAKSKLAPLNGSSTPRQELLAMNIVAQLKTWVIENIPIEIKRSIIISDSTSALNQIRNKAVLFNSYEQTRIRNVQALTHPSEFHFTRSRNNSADLPSKMMNVTKEMLYSDAWKKGTFLHKAEDSWPITPANSIKVQDLKDISGVASKYKNVNLAAISVIDGNELNQEIMGTYIDINSIEVMEAEDDDDSYLNNMLSKQKKTVNAAAARKSQAKKNTRKNRPGFLQTSKEIDQILDEGDPEVWADMLRKHRNLGWSLRVIAYAMKLRYNDMDIVSLVPKVLLLLQQQASIKTKQYMLRMSGVHDVIYEDANGIVRLENRQFVGVNEYPQESIVLSLNTALASAILRQAHDRHHMTFSRSIRAAIRSGQDDGQSYYIPRCRQFLDRESRNCPKCILARGLRMQARMGKLPRRRHRIQDIMRDVQLDTFGPWMVKSLSRNDRRETKCWALICCCMSSGIVSVQMLMDSTASSVIVALNTLKTQFGDIRSLSFDPATNFTPMGRFSDDNIDDGDNEQLDAVKEYATASGIQVFISPPKTSFWQGISEKLVDKFKGLMFLEPKRNLHIIELQSVLKQFEYIINGRPVSQDQEGCLLTRLHLLGHRTRNGVNEDLFDGQAPLVHAGQFQDHVEAIEDMVGTFWIKYKNLLLEDFLRIQNHRFPGHIIPKTGDVCCLPDKCNRVGGMAIGEIVAIKPSSDGEARVCIVEIARKKRRTHPFPLKDATHSIKRYERHVNNLIFLLRPKRDSKFKQIGKSFLYEDLMGTIDHIDDTDSDNDDENEDEEMQGYRNQRDLRDLLELTKSVRDEHTDTDDNEPNDD